MQGGAFECAGERKRERETGEERRERERQGKREERRETTDIDPPTKNNKNQKNKPT